MQSDHNSLEIIRLRSHTGKSDKLSEDFHATEVGDIAAKTGEMEKFKEGQMVRIVEGELKK